MKRQNFLIFCLMLFLFSDCISRMVLRQSDLSHDLKTKESEVNDAIIYSKGGGLWQCSIK
jgi:hypothetical protein